MQNEEKYNLSQEFYPGENDVILGRGKIAFNHTGNVKFRACIDENLPLYRSSKKNDKTDLVNSIAQSVLNKNGRFVRFDRNSGKWYDVGNHAAREKVGHAFRDSIAALTKTKTRKSEQKQKLKQKMITKTQPKIVDQYFQIKAEPIPWDAVLKARKEDYPKELFSVDLLETLLDSIGEEDVIPRNDPHMDGPLVGDWHEDLLSISNHEFVCEMPRSA